MIVNSSSHFDKRCELMHKRGYDMQDLKAVLKRLIEKKLLQSDRDHKWHGSYKKKRNIRELHIKPDWLLLYYINHNIVYLVDTGSHSDFKIG
jgi:mRNA interferase YafQ